MNWWENASNILDVRNKYDEGLIEYLYDQSDKLQRYQKALEDALEAGLVDKIDTPDIEEEIKHCSALIFTMITLRDKLKG